METSSSSLLLKNEIQLLEVEKAFQEQLLKEQFYATYENLKPVNLLRSTLSDVASSPFLIDHILSTAVGLATGYLSKKVVVGASGNIFRKLLGFMMEVGVTNSVAQHPDSIRSIGKYIYHHFLNKTREKF